ncbi:MAG: epimerase [Elusimicrobia bacterium]|nr:MAG: epimerase [Elusimicrobiota bacterium]
MNAFMIFSGIAAAAHVGFFILETVIWGSPKANAIFQVSPADAETMALFARNQGFYNLFLAIGVPVGWILGKPAVVVFACAVMLGAAIVLFALSPGMLRGALIQGLPPVLALAAWRFNR